MRTLWSAMYARPYRVPQMLAGFWCGCDMVANMNFVERFLCALLGHRYVVLRVFNPGARQVGCTRCRRRWGMHDETRSFVPWDGSLEQMYRSFGEWK